MMKSRRLDIKEIVLKYKPSIMFDKVEPFPVVAVGYTVFWENKRSLSFPRWIDLSLYKAAFVVEYAFYYDYDIQHLYELEHIWIYVDKKGDLCGCEASFHGKVLNQMLPGNFWRENQVCLFAQPGKHALMPRADLLYLCPDLYGACMERAGINGLAYPKWLFGDIISLSDKEQEKVKKYIQIQYAFQPTMDFQKVSFPEHFFCPINELLTLIPNRLNRQLNRIRLFQFEKENNGAENIGIRL